MSCSIVINQSAQKLQVNKDSYDLGRISNVQVRVLSWKDKILNMMILGAIASSLLFIFVPTNEQGQVITWILPAIAFLIGACLALVISTKYEFRLEFRHSDEVGVQWFTAAKSRAESDFTLFKQWEAELKHHIR
ncbi:hypothetical protein ACB316_08645 [Aeromonas sanarellii]|uniref:hypothetical protein n=1 Tax=Aeromonas TaxID=642 RepID=UPI001C23F5C8|nr:hypothetical protein [Aeromonas sp. FDAARGOS 1409]QXC28732.1 hypothetical protein I6L39_12370 [Aeromonas sp. FDAARGOS 1409]